MSTRNERQQQTQDSEDRVYGDTWEENHYTKDSFRKAAIAERCEEAENERAKTPNWKNQ